MRARPIVAIDGPAGAGKSTVARRVAEALGYTLVDIGALYRCVALAAQRAGLAVTQREAIGELALALAKDSAIRLVRDLERGLRIHLRDEDVSDAIRTPDIAMNASTVSAIPSVRDALLELQRQAGRDGGVVLEGRDIGTVVFPDAEVKFFLTAGDTVRARRRHDELVGNGQDVTFEATLEDVRQRDAQDTMRPVAPLKQADDAILVDSSALDIDAVVRSMVERVERVESVSSVFARARARG
ncbi:(d)CMP kinase [soil metagenome]